MKRSGGEPACRRRLRLMEISTNSRRVGAQAAAYVSRRSFFSIRSQHPRIASCRAAGPRPPGNGRTHAQKIRRAAGEARGRAVASRA
ncbi:hypothetical protein WS62_20800 [Burkholderia sp. ABCPW 14]|nr:hypothetical protein WS62_20800 [Burkholderia sp. ABCPW 14]